MLILIWLLITSLAYWLVSHRFVSILMHVMAGLIVYSEVAFVTVSAFFILDIVIGDAKRINLHYLGLLLIYVLIFDLKLDVVYVLATMLVLVVARSLSSRFHRTKSLLDKDLPTVTLAIPARNEDHALTECLLAAVASDYPKLEILVLDDCSHDKTAQIIRSFAHSGVRFVQGSPPPEGWLGKNWAYAKLIEESSGEIIVFTGVDIQLDRFSIKNIVEYMIKNRKDMVSVLPQRRHLDIGSTILQPLRYIFQLGLPRLMQPPALSSAWAINAEILNEDQLEHLKDQIIPEEVLAKELSSHYKFLISTKALGVTTRKKIGSQFDTATRTAFPLLGQSLGLSFVAASLISAITVAPFLSVFTANPNYSAVVLGSVIQAIIFLQIRPTAWIIAIFQMPIAGVVYILSLLNSVYSYLSGNIEWKGRNICIPVIESRN